MTNHCLQSEIHSRFTREDLVDLLNEAQTILIPGWPWRYLTFLLKPLVSAFQPALRGRLLIAPTVCGPADGTVNY
jgi:hypothetical protein